MKKKDDEIVFGIGCYKKEQWLLLLKTAEDRTELEDTYEEWEQNLKRNLNNMRAAGMHPLRVDIDMNELLAWCKKHNLKNTGETRTDFIGEMLRQGKGRPIGIL